MRHKETVKLYRYWNELRGARAAPERREISPAALGNLLSGVMLIKCDDQGDPVFRLVGSRMCALKCRELRGESLAVAFIPKDRRNVQKIAGSVVRQGLIAVLDTEARFFGGQSCDFELALFPLAGTGPDLLGIISSPKESLWLGTECTELEIRGIRYIDPDAGLLNLQNRPSIPIDRRSAGQASQTASSGQSRIARFDAPPRTPRVFRVLDGGKK